MSYLSPLLITLAALIILVVMVQAKWSGLSIVPGSGDFGKFERRGGELMIHRITIGLITLFILTAVVAYFIA
jgi:protein translocase SecG subunit